MTSRPAARSCCRCSAPRCQPRSAGGSAVQRAIGCRVLTADQRRSPSCCWSSVDRDGPLVMHAGGWPAPIGITLVVDRLSAIMLAVGVVMLLAVLVYAIGQPGAERNHVGFQSVYLVLAAGVAGSFLTGDLFNLFVSFEMMLTASYVLLTLGGRREQVRSGMTYVVISLLASALFITALALLYSATGTVNMADLAGKIGDLPTRRAPGVRRAAGRRVRHQGRRCSRCSRGCPTATRSRPAR